MLLVRNSKMKKSGDSSNVIYNFGIPALISTTGLKTCPNAQECAVGCFARSGAYRFSNVVKAYEKRLQAALSPTFSNQIQEELNNIKKRHPTKEVIIRIHDSGDFFDETYFKKWLIVILNNLDVKFYAYTKMVRMFKSKPLPKNFTLIFSYGGKEDHLIDPNIDRHSFVFENIIGLIKSGYINASENDLEALMEKS